METNSKHPLVDAFLLNAKNWHSELDYLRNLLLATPLTETYKWKTPCYTYKDKNVVFIQAFKKQIALGFFKGTLLSDNQKILIKPGENTQTMRMIPWTNLEDIKKMENAIQLYIQEAIEVEISGVKEIKFTSEDLVFTPELMDYFQANPYFHQAFMRLTLGRQRAYHIYFSSAKQSATQLNRIEKYKQRIMNEKGFHDCVCGLSKKMPSCDGSHHLLKKGDI